MGNKEAYSHIIKYTGLFGGIQLLSILLGILKNKLVALILGPSGFGLISLFGSTLNFISNSTNLGLAMSAVKNISDTYESGEENRLREEISMVRTWILITAIIGTFVCLAFSRLLSSLTFSDESHTLHFICLSPIIGFTAVTGGELAIMKATRKLRKLAWVSIYNMIIALALSVPIYYVWGMSGVVPCLVILSLSQMTITILYSYRNYQPEYIHKLRQLAEGIPMIKLGVAFLISGAMGSGAEFLIRAYINNTASIETVGLYSAGYMIVMTYGNMIFSAMETDYYPRLSAIHEKNFLNDTVNRQSEVSLLLISPMLTAFIIFMPIMLPLLYSGKFTPATWMIRVAVMALYIRAVKLPVAYISLAKGNSRLFLIIEGLYAVLIVVASIYGFDIYGLTGIGFAITIVGMLEYVIILIFMSRKYGFCVSRSVVKYLLFQYPIGLAALFLSVFHEGWIYWICGIALITLSTSISIYIIHKKVDLKKFYKRGHMNQ